MAGTLFGIGLSQQTDQNGKPFAGCKLYIYVENTSTPVIAYSDFGLTQALPFPIQGDGAGRIPAFWVADGSYRVRLTSADGDEIFDEPSITAIGASLGTGSTASNVPAASLLRTGDVFWSPLNGERIGAVRCNGRTIGSLSSAGTERANADCEGLFLWLWNNFTNAVCPVVGGRGANAQADWDANKRITLFDFRDRTIVGLSGMGNTSTGNVSNTTGAANGAFSNSFTIGQANLPAYNLPHALTLPNHTHTTALANHIHSNTFTLPAHVHSTNATLLPAHVHSTNATSLPSHTHSTNATSLPNHTHSTTLADHTHLASSNTTGAHTHTVTGADNSAQTDNKGGNATAKQTSRTTSSDGDHSHTITIDTLVRTSASNSAKPVMTSSNPTSASISIGNTGDLVGTPPSISVGNTNNPTSNPSISVGNTNNPTASPAIDGVIGNPTSLPSMTSGNPNTSPAIAGTVPSGGSGTAISISTMQPYFVGTYFIKL